MEDAKKDAVKPRRCLPSCARASPSLPSATVCGARSVSELPRPLGPRFCSVVAGGSSVFTTKLNGSKLHFVGNGCTSCCHGLSPGKGGRHPGAALALTDLHVSECPLWGEKAKSRRRASGKGSCCGQREHGTSTGLCALHPPLNCLIAPPTQGVLPTWCHPPWGAASQPLLTGGHSSCFTLPTASASHPFSRKPPAGCL